MSASLPVEGAPRRVLVTGASGFVGGTLLRRLSADPAYEVLGLGRRRVDHPGYRSLDLSASGAGGALSALLASFRPEVIVHAAARSAPWGTRAEFRRENVDVTRTVVGAAEAAVVRPRIVHVSTASVVYRAVDQVGVAGDAHPPSRAVNGYARSKAQAEEIVRGYQGEWVVLRPRAVFGPGDTTVLPRLVEAARAGRLPRFADGPVGPALSDLVPIETLVEYILRAAFEPGAAGRTLAVTGGEPVELQHEVFELLRRAGIALPTRVVSRRAALAAARLTELGWRLARRQGEPPLTRYSVIAYAYCKTFDAAPCRALLGDPLVTTADALARLDPAAAPAAAFAATPPPAAGGASR